jgi:hypothetical protein
VVSCSSSVEPVRSETRRPRPPAQVAHLRRSLLSCAREQRPLAIGAWPGRGLFGALPTE